jgi:hypothetical protein
MSQPAKFNLIKYISEDETKEPTNDVFDELEYIRIISDPRRFSFSIPGECIELDENYFRKPTSPPQPPCSPPSSPTLQPLSTPKVTIEIPEEDDFYLDRTECFPGNDSDTEKTPTPLKDIQDEINYPKERLLTSNPSDKALYKRPPKKSFDARKIWKQAHIPRHACIRDIEYLLLDWAYTYARLQIENQKITLIIWRSHSNCICQATWTSFLRWIICSSFSV